MSETELTVSGIENNTPPSQSPSKWSSRRLGLLLLIGGLLAWTTYDLFPAISLNSRRERFREIAKVDTPLANVREKLKAEGFQEMRELPSTPDALYYWIQSYDSKIIGFLESLASTYDNDLRSRVGKFDRDVGYIQFSSTETIVDSGIAE